MVFLIASDSFSPCIESKRKSSQTMAGVVPQRVASSRHFFALMRKSLASDFTENHGSPGVCAVMRSLCVGNYNLFAFVFQVSDILT